MPERLNKRCSNFHLRGPRVSLNRRIVSIIMFHRYNELTPSKEITLDGKNCTVVLEVTMGNMDNVLCPV